MHRYVTFHIWNKKHNIFCWICSLDAFINGSWYRYLLFNSTYRPVIVQAEVCWKSISRTTEFHKETQKVDNFERWYEIRTYRDHDLLFWNDFRSLNSTYLASLICETCPNRVKRRRNTKHLRYSLLVLSSKNVWRETAVNKVLTVFSYTYFSLLYSNKWRSLRLSIHLIKLNICWFRHINILHILHFIMIEQIRTWNIREYVRYSQFVRYETYKN